ncbi:MAG: response regulator [Anaerolineae bacterium]|nr:response regulator [Anaerolineae bacterium]
MERTEFGTPDDLGYLREESLRPVLFGVMIALYVWYVILFRPLNPIGAAFWGPMLLAVGLTIAFFTRRRNVSLASAALIAGIAAANLTNMWLLATPSAPYLMAIVVGLTGLLFGLRSVVAVTLLSSAAILGIGYYHLGLSLVSEELLAPVLVIVLVGVSSSLTVRNLYHTLYWAWDRTMAVQENEKQLLDRQGELARALKSLDVAYTQLERLNYDLARAHRAADEARLAKQQFATNISHELRTPLNVVMAFSEMMYLSPASYSVPLPPQYRGDIREIYRSSKHLLQLTDDVLSLSRIEAKEMRIHPEPTGLKDVITEAISVIRPLLRDKAVKLVAHVPDTIPSLVIDRARVSQVILNLLNNARRFTEQGSITVEAKAKDTHVEIVVADTGIGIPAQAQPLVFKEFQQIDSTSFVNQQGSGLGLAISKRFVEMHGGRIWVESAGVPGQGSRFYFTLPFHPPLFFAEETAETGLSVRTPSSRSRKVLLFDPDPYIGQIIEEAVDGVQVVPFEAGADIGRRIRDTQAGAIIINLAQKDQAWRQILQLQEHSADVSLPVIMCPLVGPTQLGQALGVKDYLVKPVTRSALVALLDRLGLERGRILVIDDDPRMGNLLTRLLQTHGQEYEIIRAGNGDEGLALLRRQRPDLVLMDISMPKMDGYTLLRYIRDEPHLNDLPIAMITANIGTIDDERKLGGQTMMVSNLSGLSNDEVLTYLRHILEASMPLALPHGNQAIQRSQQVGLDNGFA